MFSVVHLAPATDVYSLIPGSGAFEQDTVPSCSDSTPIPNSCSKWVPGYWRQLDDLVQVANNYGMVVFLAGVMDPRDLGSANDSCVLSNYPLASNAAVFARNIVARLYGNHVIFSPGYDDKTSCSGIRSLAIAVGNEIKAATNRHLISYHPGGQNDLGDDPPNAPQNLHSQNRIQNGWLDFDMVQSGHVGNVAEPTRMQRATKRARTFPQYLRYDAAITPKIPAVNGEAAFDDNTTSLSNVFATYRTRQYGYYSMLSGSFGYTFGANTIWDWQASGSSAPAAINWNSAKQMTTLFSTFNGLHWERLVGSSAEHCRVQNQPGGCTGGTLSDMPKKWALARDGTDAVLAYAPHEQNQIAIDLTVLSATGFPTGWTLQWVSPQPGVAPRSASFTNSGWVYTFPKPVPACPLPSCDAVDWVLRLVRNIASPMSLAASNPTFLWSEPEDDGTKIAASITSASGLVAESEFDVSTGGEERRRLPRLALNASGQSLVVWESDGRESRYRTVLGRLYAGPGNSSGAEFSLASKDGEGYDQADPVVAPDPAGGFVVAWSVREPESGVSAILARRFHSSGTPHGKEFEVSKWAGGEQGFPRVAIGPGGELIVAWERDGNAILARSFDASGKALSDQFLVVGDAESVALSSIEPQLDSLTIQYERRDAQGRSLGILGRSFALSGQPLGTEALLVSPEAGVAE